MYMDKNTLKKYTTEIIFNQDELNVFCRIMHLEHTAHDDLLQANNIGYKQTLVPVIYAMSTSLSIMNDFVFTDYDPLELYREYICIRPIFVGSVYRMEYILKSIDYEEYIGTVIIRLKNDKGQVCVNGLVKLKLLNSKTDNL